jgi:hypothetical protein
MSRSDKTYRQGYYERNKKSILKQQKEYRDKPLVKQRIRKYLKKYWISHRNDPKRRKLNSQYQKKRNRIAIHDLTDSYIKNILYHQSGGILMGKDVPDEIVNAKRLHLQLKRLLKNISQNKEVLSCKTLNRHPKH